MGSWLNPDGPIYQGPDPLDLGDGDSAASTIARSVTLQPTQYGDGSIGDNFADIVTGDDPNDNFDGGQWFNKLIPGTPAAAAEEFGGPKEPEDWEEDGGPFDVTQEESENTVGQWSDNVTQDALGVDFQTALWVAVGIAALYLLAPLLEIASGVAGE